MILVTGGFGFIGLPLVKALVKRGYEVLVFDRQPNPEALGEYVTRLTIVRGDVTAFNDVLDVMKRYQIRDVFHLAALLSSACEANPLLGFRVNVEGTLNVLEAARTVGVNRFIFPSTLATYGSELPLVVNEETRQEPLTFYGATKVFCELWGLQYHRRFGLDFRSVRLPAVIGPGRTDGGASVYSSLMIEKPALGEEYTVYVDEETSIPIIYIEEIPSLLMSLYQAVRVKSRILNVGALSPKAGEIAEKVKKYVPNATIKFDPNPELVAMVRKWPVPDSSRIKEELGWKLSYDLDSLVRDFIAEVRSGNYKV